MLPPSTSCCTPSLVTSCSSQCDGYALIANRLPSVLSPDAIVPFELTDSVEDIHMDVQDSDGNIVEMKPGVRFRF